MASHQLGAHIEEFPLEVARSVNGSEAKTTCLKKKPLVKHGGMRALKFAINHALSPS